MTIYMIFEICILLILVISAIGDIRNKEISLREVAACVAVSASSATVGLMRGETGVIAILLSLIPGGIILLIGLLSRQQVGYGDALLALGAGPAMGLFCMGAGLLLALFFSSIFSLCLLAFKKAGKRTRIPFVPFMALGLGVMCFAPV